MKIDFLSPSNLIHPDYNPRKISKHDLENLKASLKNFGFVEPIVVNKAKGRENIVIGGNQRLEAAKALGFESVPCFSISIPEIEKEKELNVRLNRNIGEWDWDKLANEFDEKALLDWGFTNDQLDFKPAPDEEKDAVPEPPKNPRSKSGHIYSLGEHRLLCGDSTIFSNVKKLFEGFKNADLCLTDPPYSVDYKSRKEKPDQTLQSYQDPKDAMSILTGFLQCMPAECLIMSYTDNQLHPYVLAMESIGFETIDLLIWKKQNFIFWMGSRYQQQHELIFLARKKGAKFYSKTKPNQSTVLEIDRLAANDIHPTQRPPELWDLLLTNHSKKNDLIYDPFLGSGTTLIECQKLGRKCFGVEISPHFCDVIIKRYCNFTGDNEDAIYENAISV